MHLIVMFGLAQTSSLRSPHLYHLFNFTTYLATYFVPILLPILLPSFYSFAIIVLCVNYLFCDPKYAGPQPFQRFQPPTTKAHFCGHIVSWKVQFSQVPHFVPPCTLSPT